MPGYEITAPDGRVIEWDRPTPPTQKDIDALVASFKPQRALTPAPSQIRPVQAPAAPTLSQDVLVNPLGALMSGKLPGQQVAPKAVQQAKPVQKGKQQPFRYDPARAAATLKDRARTPEEVAAAPEQVPPLSGWFQGLQEALGSLLSDTMTSVGGEDATDPQDKAVVAEAAKRVPGGIGKVAGHATALPNAAFKQTATNISQKLGNGPVDPSIYENDAPSRVASNFSEFAPYVLPGIGQIMGGAQAISMAGQLNDDPEKAVKDLYEGVAPWKAHTPEEFFLRSVGLVLGAKHLGEMGADLAGKARTAYDNFKQGKPIPPEDLNAVVEGAFKEAEARGMGKAPKPASGNFYNPEAEPVKGATPPAVGKNGKLNETKTGIKVQGTEGRVGEEAGSQGPGGVGGLDRAQKGQEAVQEGVTPPVEATGARNSITTAERTARGEEPVQKQEYATPQAAQAAGEKLVESGENHEALARDVADKPRALTPNEYGVLLAGRRRLINEFNSLGSKIDNGIAKGEDVKALQDQYQNVRERLNANDEALVRSGRESSASLNARKMGATLNEGSYAEVQQEARRQKGAPLTPKEEGQLKQAVAAHNQALEKIAQLEERLAAVNSAKEIRKVGRKMTAADLDAEYATLQNELVRNSAKLSAGIDPGAVTTVGKMVVNRIRRGGVSAAQAIDDVYNAVKDHIPISRDQVRKAAADLHAADKAANRAKAELNYEAQQKARAVRAQLERLKPRSFTDKAVGVVRDVAGIPRTLKTSFDLSAPLRQAAILTVNNPKLAAKAFGAQLKAFRDPVFSREYNTRLLQGPNASVYRKAKLYLSDAEAEGVGKHEEEFVSKIAGKVPGVQGSERAYTTYLNTMRAGTFDRMYTPGMSEAEIKGIANFINVATGRGSLGALENSANGVAQILFSPRNLASRFQLLAGQPLLKSGSPRVAAKVAKQYATFAGMVYATMKLAEAAGATVNYTNPDDPDWMKIKIGDSRIDMLAGLQQAARFAFRMGAAKGDEREALNVAKQFAKSKLAPTPGYLYSAYVGKDYSGKPFDASDTAKDVVTPLIAQDTYEAMKAQGIPGGLALGILSALGLGVSTYNNGQKDKNIYDAAYEKVLGNK